MLVSCDSTAFESREIFPSFIVILIVLVLFERTTVPSILTVPDVLRVNVIIAFIGCS